MRIWNGWLLIDPQDTVDFQLNYREIEEQEKHYVVKARRSFLHYDRDCAFCAAGVPLRRRFIAPISLQDINLCWEFGADVRRQLKSLEELVDKTGFLMVRVHRGGHGPNTFYRCSYATDEHQTFFGKTAAEIAAENEYRLKLFKQFHPGTP